MRTGLAALALTALCAACTDDATRSTSSATPSPTPSPSSAYSVDILPADFSPEVTNPWFPLTPGTTLVYEGTEGEDELRELYEVVSETQQVEGVVCRVVLDRVYVDGELEETTRDYYAQHKDGSVWYFGEDTATLTDGGRMESTDGTWHFGEAGALPGVFMPAVPAVGDTHRQEYYPGHAEDFFEVVDLSVRVRTPYRSFPSALLTKEWSPLEPEFLGAKYYVKGIGQVREVTLKGSPKEELLLVEVRRGQPPPR